MDFTGAKTALFLRDALVVIQRDENTDIPFPRHLDFPGGGKNPGETPIECALREALEEVGLCLCATDLIWSRQYGQSWFFVAMRPSEDVGLIRFGDEGQGWRLMHPQDYLTNSLAIPSFVNRLRDYLSEMGRL
ncbi:8-oxo-dGTP diphosphatase [Ruegeria halocynthiae]|uniref:8-oxo-dGTP diphosphatase n=1 Tax=Ruegeria halocynthiae TaxID=985054 RepID=A0A1H3FFQ4_9RHOB|nr:NUDIX hydrolase [Ruegeria halocynthiae]SDX88974.1 8-oxo-dGTP diphosphatase [Ruegeria halocynthiae]